MLALVQIQQAGRVSKTGIIAAFHRRTTHNKVQFTGDCRNVHRWRFIDPREVTPQDCHQEGFAVKDIQEVLHKKQAELARLGKQIEALQSAAEQLRGVAHLLHDEPEDREAATNG